MQRQHSLRVVAAVCATVALGLGSTRPAATPATGARPDLQALLDRAAVDLPFNPRLAAASCPIERGPVKEGADRDRNKVSTTVHQASVNYLRTRTPPSSFPTNNRIYPVEDRTWQVTATLTQYKLEADGDYHLVIKDAAGRKMIAEIPYVSCVPSSSRWRSSIAAARRTFAGRNARRPRGTT
jgi:hypothetical protein